MPLFAPVTKMRLVVPAGTASEVQMAQRVPRMTVVRRNIGQIIEVVAYIQLYLGGLWPLASSCRNGKKNPEK